MAPGRKPIPLTLTADERTELEGLVRRRSVGQALATRVRVVLACAEPGATNIGVSRALGVSRPTVLTWRERFVRHRMDGLIDAPRSGAPRGIGDDRVEDLVTLTLETQPEGATHWWTRLMARRVGMSQTAVSRIG
jgi:transposase